MATQFNFDLDSFGLPNPMMEEQPILNGGEALALTGALGGVRLNPFLTGSMNQAPSPTLSPATGPRGGTGLPTQPSLSQARDATARSAASGLKSASALSRFAGPGTALLGLVDLGSRAFTGKGIGEIGGELIGNVLFPGAQSLPAEFNAPTLNDLAAMRAEESSFINPGGPNQEELFGVDPEGFGDRGRENYCKSTYGPDVTPEECDLFEDRRGRAEREFGQSGVVSPFLTNPMLDYSVPILGQQDSSSSVQQQDFSPSVPSLADLQQSGAEASFVLPSGEVRTIRPEQDVASAFGRESGTRTFNVDEGSVTVPSNLLADTMGFTVPSLEDIQNVLPPEVATDDTFVPDGRSSFFTESAAREQRMRDRERQPGETQAQRDTRLARSRTLEGRARAEARGSGVRGKMTFEEARKFVAREENFRGEKESVASYNQRIREYAARYNSDPQEAAREANRLVNEGKRLSNEATQARIDNYKKTEAQKYKDVVSVADLLVEDGLLTEAQKVFFVIDQMGGDIKKLFAKPSTPSDESDSKTDTSSLVSQLTGQTSSSFDPSKLSGEFLDAYNFAIDNPNDPRSASILDRLRVNFDKIKDK